MAEWLPNVEHLRAWLTLAYAVYLFALILWVILQKHDPVVTVGWILTLAFLPYIGFFIYFLLGPRRIKRQRLRRVRSLQDLPMHERDGHQAHGRFDQQPYRLALKCTGLPAATATDVQWLVDGAATYAAILSAIGSARQHVHMEYYIFQPDVTGTAIRNALIARAQAGVKVRLLLDAVGSYQASRHFLQPLLDAGAQVVWFHPSRPLTVLKLERPWINLRLHRKIIVVDASIAFTGGINITDEENESLRPNAYRDLHMCLRGDIVRSIQQVFLEDWLYASGGNSDDIATDPGLWPPAVLPGAISAQALACGPDSPWEAIHRLHISAIAGARHRVWLATPYFVPSEAALMALTSAALSGVDVRVLVPALSDSLMVTLAARSYYDELHAADVSIYEYGPRILHSKALLVDDDTCIVGSANFDKRSFRLNFELSMLLTDRQCASGLENYLLAEFAAATPVAPPAHRQPLLRRIPEAVARLFSPLF